MEGNGHRPAHPPRRRRARPFVIAGVGFVGFFAVVFALITALLLHQGRKGWVVAGAAADLRRAGVTYIPAARAYVVTDGDRFEALSARDPHLHEVVLFCPSSQWFEEPLHGDKFDRLGFYRVGPAPRGLDRLAFRIANGVASVNPQVSSPGPPRGSGDRDPQTGPFCSGSRATPDYATGRWANGP
jgi:nitrite reductase/ring-hydroxylating ferredoxin subunit